MPSPLSGKYNDVRTTLAQPNWTESIQTVTYSKHCNPITLHTGYLIHLTRSNLFVLHGDFAYQPKMAMFLPYRLLFAMVRASGTNLGLYQIHGVSVKVWTW